MRPPHPFGFAFQGTPDEAHSKHRFMLFLKHMPNQRKAGMKFAGVWLTDSERQRLRKLAETRGCKTLSALFKTLIPPDPSLSRKKKPDSLN
jgi:hypothetical protein